MLNTVPIVLSSPLDILYRQFPVAIVDHWSDVLQDGWVEITRAHLELQFGSEPFLNASVVNKLTATYWTDLIRSTSIL